MKPADSSSGSDGDSSIDSDGRVIDSEDEQVRKEKTEGNQWR